MLQVGATGIKGEERKTIQNYVLTFYNPGGAISNKARNACVRRTRHSQQRLYFEMGKELHNKEIIITLLSSGITVCVLVDCYQRCLRT
jgi:hypothetical protein